MIYLCDGSELGRVLGLKLPPGLAIVDLRGPGAAAALDGLVSSTLVDEILENYLSSDALKDGYI